MNVFALKLIALITMIIDHMGVVFPDTFGFEFRVIGRLAFPIFVFLLAEGFRYTKSHGKFLIRLFVFAVISQPVFGWALKGTHFPYVNFFENTNIFYTLFFGGAAITVYEMTRKWYDSTTPPAIKSKIFSVVMAAVSLFTFAWLAEDVFSSDYGAYGVVFIFIMYIVRCKDFSLYKSIGKRSDAVYKILPLITMAVLCLYQFDWMFRHAFESGFSSISGMWWAMVPVKLVSVILVAFYNGKRGPGLKWLFYAAYPLHLGVLMFIMQF